MSIINAIYFIPAFVAALWVSMLVFKKKNKTQYLLLWLMLLSTYYHTTYALYASPWTDYDLMAKLDVLNYPISLSILALNIVFVKTHDSLKLYKSPLHTLLYLPVVIYAVVAPMLYYLVGNDNAALFKEIEDYNLPLPAELDTPVFKMFDLVTDTVFKSICAAGILATILLCIQVARKQGFKLGDVTAFLFKGASTTPGRAVCLMDALTILMLLPIDIMGRNWMIHHAYISATIITFNGFFLFLLCYMEYIRDLKNFTLFNLTHVSFDERMMNQATEVEEAEEITTENNRKQKPTAAISPNKTRTKETSEVKQPGKADTQPEKTEAQSTNANARQNSEVDADAAGKVVPSALAAQITKAFEEDLIYRDPELSIKSLADKLGTNRTTLSMAINQFFEVPFRQLVSNYRIDAAKTYMTEHPDATQDTIAVECGYTSAQAFNIKFKEVTGLSPRAWLTQNKG